MKESRIEKWWLCSIARSETRYVWGIVIFDERFDRGHWVRSSKIVSLDEEKMFARTARTEYTLIGPGKRRSLPNDGQLFKFLNSGFNPDESIALLNYQRRKQNENVAGSKGGMES